MSSLDDVQLMLRNQGNFSSSPLSSSENRPSLRDVVEFDPSSLDSTAASVINKVLVMKMYPVPGLPYKIFFSSQAEYDAFMNLPMDIRITFINIVRLFDHGTLIIVSSVRMYFGETLRQDSVTHSSGRAVDFLPVDPHLDVLVTRSGQLRSPRFWANPYYVRELRKLAEIGDLKCATGLETHHLHLSDDYPAGLYLYPSCEPSMSNDNPKNPFPHIPKRIA
jgi:hypothetical protein